MASQMMLLEECLPLEALRLGCLVESIKNPIMDAYVPKEALPPEAVISMPAKSFQGLLSASNASSFRLALTRLVSASHKSENDSGASLQSMKVNRYVLKQPKELFRNMCLGDEKARQWLTEGIQANSKSYLVVELQTAQNAIITRRDSRKTSTGAEVTVPIGTIATGGADIIGVTAALDPSVEVSREVASEAHKKFEWEGESIFAVGYKKVLWKSFGLKKKEVDKAVLDKEITWSLLGKKRSREDDEERVAVDLADDLQAPASAGLSGTDEGEEIEEDEDEQEETVELFQNGVEIGDQTYFFAEEEGGA